MGDFDLRLHLGAGLDLLGRDLDGAELDPPREDSTDQIAEVLELRLGPGEAKPFHDALHSVWGKEALELLRDLAVHVPRLGLLVHVQAFL